MTIPEDAFGEADYTAIISAVRTAAERSAQGIAVIKIVAKDKVAPPGAPAHRARNDGRGRAAAHQPSVR